MIDWVSVKDGFPSEDRKERYVFTYSESTGRYGTCNCVKEYVTMYGNSDKVTHWAYINKPKEEAKNG